MPVDSIIERIRLDKLARLENVKIANDYSHDFTVEPRKRGGNAPKAGQTLCVLMQFGSQRINADPGNPDSHQDSTTRQVFAVDVFVDPNIELQTDIDKVLNQVKADVEKAVAGTDEARECSGYAFDTWMGITFQFTQGPHQGAQIQFIVQYSTAFNDPLTLAAGH